jgi:hypothetical protein
LYEVARERLSALGQEGQNSRRGASVSERLQPGSALRLPIGLVIAGVIVVLVVVVLAWSIGFSVGSDGTEAGQGKAAGDEVRSMEPPGPIIDPLDPSMALIDVPAPDDPVIEPRTVGKWYFVLAETRPEGARRLAAFCKAQGLAAAAVPGHNTRLERVIALHGLDTASTTTAAYRLLDDRIRAVGRRWKVQGGTTALSDRYLERWKHQP